jgi:hypothetical protein
VGLGGRVTKQDLLEMKKVFYDPYMRMGDRTQARKAFRGDISALLQGLDRQLFLLLKTVGIMRSNNLLLGNEVNRYVSLLPCA